MDRRMRDGRNPYGSRGGYVTSRDSRRMDYAYRDRRNHRADYARLRSRDYANKITSANGETYIEPRVRYSQAEYGVPVEDYARYDRNRDYAYDRGEYRPIEIMGRFGGYYSMDEEDYGRGDYNRDYNRDYRGYDYRDRDYNRYDYAGYSMDYASDEEELKYFEKKLMEQIEPNAKSMLEKQQIMSKAKSMGIKFDEYSEEEFYIVVLMMYTDFGKTLGSSSPEIYVRMAKDWLEDKDSNLKYSDKLYEYLEKIVDAQ